MKPKNAFEKRENILAALSLAEQAGVRAPLSKESHFIEHNLVYILGFVWSVILHFSSTKFQGPGRQSSLHLKRNSSSSKPPLVVMTSSVWNQKISNSVRSYFSFSIFIPPIT